MDLAVLKVNGNARIDAAAIGLCMVVSFVWYVTAAEPLLDQRAVTAGMRREMEAQGEKASRVQAAAAAAGQQAAQVRQELAAHAIQLQPTTHVNKRIAGLTEFFSACELQVDDMRTGRISSGPGYDLVPVTIVGRGAYRQCVRFLHELHETFPDMSVIRIELAGNPVQPSEPERFRLELFWYAAPSTSSPSRVTVTGNPENTNVAWSRALHE